jgi:hypothetical protein
MKKQFILLVDFSEYSANLIQFAANWGNQIQAKIVLVHQTDIFVPSIADIESKHQIINQVNKAAYNDLTKLANQYIPSSLTVSVLVSEKPLLTTLSRLLKKQFDNLVFVGIKGKGRLKSLFLGSTVLNLIENTNAIIVALPRQTATLTPENFYVAVSDKHPFNKFSLSRFLGFIEPPTSKITFFYLAKPDAKAIQIENQLNELADHFEEKFQTQCIIYQGDNPFHDIKKVINDKTTEILIVQRGSRLLSDRVFRKFMINELVFEAQTPLIILPEVAKQE